MEEKNIADLEKENTGTPSRPVGGRILTRGQGEPTKLHGIVVRMGATWAEPRGS